MENKKKLNEAFLKKNKIIILLIIVIVFQTLIFIKAATDKSYIHMDEAYSLGLASYDKVEIQDNQDFYNTWHTKEYYEDYLSVQEDEMSKYSQVYENQKNDVHPPLYYLLLRIAMGFSPNHFSKWPGIILNMIIYAFITLFVYLISSKLLEGKKYHKEKSIILAFLSAITLSSLSNVIYIRMYALSTLNVLIITYLHIKLYEKYNKKTLAFIGIIAVIGSLTHYYFLFYLAMLYLVTVLNFLANRENKKIRQYTIALVIAGIISILVFPFSIKHMFFGYRGDGVISNLTDITKIPSSILKIFSYLGIVQYYAFNNILVLIILIIIGIFVYRKKKKINQKIEISKYFKLIYLPTIFYLVLVAVSSPWIELRYIMPICALIFISLLYWLNQLLETVLNKKNTLKLMIVIIALIIISPFILKTEPQVAYSDKREIVYKLENELNLPTIYCFNSSNNRFLDDILLFSVIDESYIAKDIEYTEENIKNILCGKDISNGIIIFINEGQNNDSILNSIMVATKLDNSTHLKRMNACDIYYLK